MLLTGRGAGVASLLAARAVLVLVGVLGAFGRACTADVGAQGAEVAVVRRAPGENLQRGGADVGAVEIEQRARAHVLVLSALADVVRRALLAGVQP